jgi:hypothetical protein
MKNLTIAFMVATAFAAVGCKKKGGAGEAMAKMGEFKDKMCACKDKKCADGVQDEMNKWSAESAKNAGDKPEKPDEKTMKEMQDVGTKYGECMAKAMGGGETPPPPPETGSGSAAAGSGSAAAAGPVPTVGEGPVVPAKTLFLIDLPAIPGVPEKAVWSPAYAEKDGDRLVNLMEGDKSYVGVHFIDCNMPKMKEFISKSVDDRAEWQYCFQNVPADAPKIKTYPRIMLADETGVAIKVGGHVVVSVDVNQGPAKGKITKEDLAKWLETVDLSSLEK